MFLCQAESVASSCKLTVIPGVQLLSCHEDVGSSRTCVLCLLYCHSDGCSFFSFFWNTGTRTHGSDCKFQALSAHLSWPRYELFAHTSGPPWFEVLGHSDPLKEIPERPTQIIRQLPTFVPTSKKFEALSVHMISFYLPKQRWRDHRIALRKK